MGDSDGALGDRVASGASAAQKQVPPTRNLRALIREQAVRRAAELPVERPIRRADIEAKARAALADCNLPEAYLGWAMVSIGSAFWRTRVTRIPYTRRLLLLPHCLRNVTVCRARYDAEGLHCLGCGGCDLTAVKAEAERLGYDVLIAEGSPVVMRRILAGKTDAVLGVACLNTLEKSLEKILTAGIPCMAVPLLADGCKSTSVDLDWVYEMVRTPYREGGTGDVSYLSLMRAAARLMERESLVELLPEFSDAIAAAFEAERETQSCESLMIQAAGRLPALVTEIPAFSFLRAGGKFYRPFITLAAYDAVTGSRVLRGEAEPEDVISNTVRCAALAVEVFHKASLVHDDIEDDDAFRYGRPALHRQYGEAAAINIGDFLIGVGYRLLADEKVPATKRGALVALFSQAHLRLSRGQGAELLWRRTGRDLSPVEILKMYAWKTSPAFEAALFAGILSATEQIPQQEVLAAFSRHLGVAFQIQNDLDEWEPDPHNKRLAGGDVLDGKPNLLWALARYAGADIPFRDRISEEYSEAQRQTLLAEIWERYYRVGAIDRAVELLERHRARAIELAGEVRDARLRELLEYFADAMIRKAKCS
ncbi:polyprenyl synthetase family protein [Thermostilla marina]